VYFSVFLIFEKFIGLKILDKIPKVFRHIYAMIIILIGWIIFRVENIHSLIQIFKMLVVFKPSEIDKFIGNNGDILGVWPYMLLGLVFCTPIIRKIMNFIVAKTNNIGKNIRDVALVTIFSITIVFLLSLSYNPFIYFRF